MNFARLSYCHIAHAASLIYPEDIIKGAIMQSSKAKQSGFTIIEGVLIVVALVALIGGGWLVYQRTKQSATRTDAAPNPNQSTTTTPAPTVTYLDIKEWGIKFPLPDSIKDAYYVPGVQNRADDGTPLAMFIGMKSLDAAGCDANSANVAGGRSTALGVIIRISPTDVDHVSGVEYVKEYPSITIGNYAYAFDDTTKAGNCASATTLQSISAAFGTATKSATPTTATPTN